MSAFLSDGVFDKEVCVNQKLTCRPKGVDRPFIIEPGRMLGFLQLEGEIHEEEIQ